MQEDGEQIGQVGWGGPTRGAKQPESAVTPEDAIAVRFLREALPDLVAVYRFGSTVSGQTLRESDVDFALLGLRPLEPLQRWEWQEQLATRLHRPVDLVDLLRASTVLRMQVVSSGIVLFESNRTARERFETAVFSSYARLNEERREILDQVRREGTVYGR